MWLSQESQRLKCKESICDYLKVASVNYVSIDLNDNPEVVEIAEAQNALVRGAIFQDEQGIFMAVVPHYALLDINFLAKSRNDIIKPLSQHKFDRLFLQGEDLFYPPLSEYFGICAIIDEAILRLEEVYFKLGTDNIYICMKQEAFLKLQQAVCFAKITTRISDIINLEGTPKDTHASIQYLVPLRMRQRLKQTVRLPAMPSIAGKILRLRFDPRANARRLSAIIQKDPSLTAQLISWAQPPYYGWRNHVTNIEDVIVKVLGYDLAVNLTLMTAFGQTLQFPIMGPLGLREYWREALIIAATTNALVERMPPERQPPRELAYSAGLLHNFGHFLLGQLSPPYYQLLRNLFIVNPHIPLHQIEQYAFGISHDELSIWLMESWCLPKEIITTVRYYREENYHSDYAVYANLVLIATRLFLRYEIGNNVSKGLPPQILSDLGINERQAEEVIEEVLSGHDEVATILDQ